MGRVLGVPATLGASGAGASAPLFPETRGTDMDQVVVRGAVVADAELVAAFNARMARETEAKELDPERLLRGVRAVFERPERGRYFVAERDGRGVGCCLITPEWSDWRAAEFWWLQSVYVLPEERGRGVFRALYDHVLGAARARGDVCGLRLYVEHENRRAQAVYEAVGMPESHYRLHEIDFFLGSDATPGERVR